MAKRRAAAGGGGSSIGLIITLIFFILSTVTLGVTTYIGFQENKERDEKLKKAEADVKRAEQERDWQKYQAVVYRSYLGYPAGKDDKDTVRTLMADWKAKLAAGDKANIPQLGTLPTSDAEAREVLKSLDNDLPPWKGGAEATPPKTYKDLVREKDDAVAKARTQADRARKDLEDLQQTLVQTTARAEQAEKVFNDKRADLEKKAEEARQDDIKKREDLQKLANSESAKYNNERVAHAKSKKEKEDLAEQLKTATEALTAASTAKTEAVSKLNEAVTQKEELLKRIPQDEKTVAEKALNAEALKVLQTWPQDKLRWKIVQLDQKGTMPYINLGSADLLEPGVTFSVHSMGRDGKLSPVPKGTVEVKEIMSKERHLARVRVTSVTDEKNDPIVAGDHLFNPTWSPGAPKRVAIAGLADLGGEGTDISSDLRRLLARQGVIVDAYINTKDDKEPRLLKGTPSRDDKDAKGEVTSRTSYLIIADGLEVVKHPKRNDKDYAKKFNDLMTELQDKAKANGVTVISLARYLDLIGYKAPKVATPR